MIKFRRMRKDDIEHVAVLVKELHSELTREESEAEVKYFCENKTYKFFVAVSSGKQIIGYVYGAVRRDYVEGSRQFINPKVGYIESLFVLPLFRKSGVARALCRQLEEWAKSKGCNEFASDALMSNKQSIAFHKALGFDAQEPVIHFIKKI